MKIISFVCQKGGTGKTTLTLSMATEAISHGLNVAIIDLDPQASACEWSDLRQKENPIVIDAQPARIEAVIQKARDLGVNLLLIDTAGRTEQAALAGARVSDLVIMPLQPSVIDLKTVSATMDLIKLSGPKKCFAILTRVKPFGDRHKETITWLENQNITVCPHTIGDRITFQDAYAVGQGVSEIEPKGKASQEIKDVYFYTCIQVGIDTSLQKEEVV